MDPARTRRSPPCSGPARRSRSLLALVLSGLALLGITAALGWVSRSFDFGLPLAEQPVVIMVIIELLAGTVFLLAVAAITRFRSSRAFGLAWVVLIGIALRAIMMASSPMLEHDFYRYLWDGSVLAHGLSPFRYAPSQVLEAPESVPEELRVLAAESGQVLSRINHPELRTIYPPVAQAAFAAAYWLKPWSLFALRCVLALFDAATFLLLLVILHSLDAPRLLVAVYWWNPLVLTEIYNTLHMDVVCLPFALMAVLLSVKRRYVLAAASLALGVGCKVWPVVLVPVVLAPVWHDRKKFSISLGVFVCLCGLLFLPVYVCQIDATSGFIAYGTQWEMNDSLYRLVSWGVKQFFEALSLDPAPRHLVTRALVLILLAAWIARLLRVKLEEPSKVWERSLLIVAAVFLLSPTQFPWYFLWVVPFLVVRPRPSLLLLSCLLPIYYLIFFFRPRGEAEIFNTFVVWWQYVPVWCLLLWEWRTDWEARLDSTLWPKRDASCSLG